MIGTIMLANRFGLARGFTDADRTLFETLAANASAALHDADWLAPSAGVPA